MNLFQRLGGLATISACFSFCTATGYASTTPYISVVSASPATSGPYVGNETINYTNSLYTAKISQSSVTCPIAETGGCTGVATTFVLTLSSFSSSMPFNLTIDGNLAGETGAGAEVAFTSPLTAAFPFRISTGNFSELITVGSSPVPGNLTIDGDLSLTMAPGQTLSLPGSFDININTPEPASLGTLGIGLAAGLLFLGKLRRSEK